ncbi:hypothetical protein ACWY4P_01670 [Streptomyces sp. LZ34]
MPRTAVFDKLRALRRDMYEPGRGTWVGARLFLCPKDSPEEDGFDWGSNVFPSAKNFPWRDEVTAADCVQELAAYPLPEEKVQWWMNWKSELHGIAEAFDPGDLLARPQEEQDLVALLPRGDEQLFARARETLDRFLPNGGELLRIGRLAEGRWSVVGGADGHRMADGPLRRGPLRRGRRLPRHLLGAGPRHRSHSGRGGSGADQRGAGPCGPNTCAERGFT